MAWSASRITDLFSEGETVLLGFEDLEPVTVWVNKLNAFEVQEARADGTARRSARMRDLCGPESPEKLGFDAETGPMSQALLAAKLVEARGDEIYLDVINDIETDPDWRERRERMERLPGLLDDSGASEDDPRREALLQDQRDWMEAISTGQAKRSADALAEAIEIDREDLLGQLWDRYCQRQTMDVFMAERRATSIYFAMRDCDATDVATEPGRHDWDHENCNHNARSCADRKDVFQLPDQVIEKVQESLDRMTLSTRAAGNSDAPASSSGSSGPASAEAEDSTPSSPEAT